LPPQALMWPPTVVEVKILSDGSARFGHVGSCSQRILRRSQAETPLIPAVRIPRATSECLAGYADAGQGCDDVSGWLLTHKPIMHLKFVVRQRSQQLPVGHAGFTGGIGP